MSSGEQQNTILVIEPTSTMWMHFNPGTRNEKMYELGNAFEDFVDELERCQVEYDLGCENIIRDHGKTSGRQFIINQRGYNLVVLPPGLENLDHPTVNLLEKYLAGGGEILSFVPPPGYIDGIPGEKISQLFKQYREQCILSKGGPASSLAELTEAAPVTFNNPESLPGLLFHHRRELKDGHLLFLVNSSLEENARGSFTAQGRSVLSFDPWSGSVSSYQAETKDGILSAAFDLDPASSLLLFISDREKDYPVQGLAPQEWSAAAPTGEMEIMPASENVLVLDYCYLTMGEDKEKEHYFYAASDKIFKFHGFEDNPWVSSSQYKTGIVDRDTFPAGRSGFRTDFIFLAEKGTDTTGMKLIVEKSGLYRLSVNSTEITALPDTWWLDPEFGVFKIGALVMPGKNIITLVADPMSVYCELAPVFILGNFSLRPAGKGWEMIPAISTTLGSWSKQGRPYYHDAVTYKRIFMVDDPEKPFKVKLGKWNGTVAVVTVNGREAGIIFTNPWELAITGMLNEGENIVEVKVVGSLKNLLGPHHNITRQGLVTP